MNDATLEVIDEDSEKGLSEGAPAPAPDFDRPPKRSWVDDPRVHNVVYGATAVFVFYKVLERFWPAPFGVLVQGVLIGALSSLVAFGIALIYRANRVINFAQADLGGVPASLVVVLIVSRNWPYPFALVTGLAAALLLGAFVEYVFIRRFSRAPRLILTVVTIGLVSLLTAAELALPTVFHLKSPPQNFKSPFNFSFTINPIVFHGNAVLAIVVVPVVLVALGAFFRYTDIGVAIRASAESADRASLLGVPVKRINTVVWVLASLLAFIGLFLRAGVVGLPIGTALGLSLLVRALAAAVIGRMEKFGTIFIASIAIGLIEQSVVWHTRKSILVDPILFVVIIGALLIQRRSKGSRVEDQIMSSWQAVQVVRPIPRELARLPEVRWGLRSIYGVLAALAVIAPPILGEGRTNLAAALIVFSIVGISLVVLTGWAGQVSLGQFAFVAVGAAVGAYISLHWHWDLLLVLTVCGVVGAVTAILIGMPALRIRGLFLAVATLSFALAMSSYGVNGSYVHWLPDSFVRIPRTPLFGRVVLDSETRYYYFCLAILVVVLVAVRGLRNSRTGRVLIGIRENERAAQAFGVNATRAKLTAFAISGFIASMAGGLYVHLSQNFLPSSFAATQGITVFVMVVVGGLGSVPGAIIGATYINGFTWFSSFFPAGIRPLLPFLGGGLGLILILMFLPGGLSSLVYRGRDRLLRRIADRRHIVVPSLIADLRTEEVVAPAEVDFEATAEAAAEELPEMMATAEATT